MTVTIKDVARETNLAVSTISKYMNGGKVRPKNKKVIEEAVERLGYRPNNFARGLRNSRSYTIGLLVPRLDSEHSARMVASLESQVKKIGCFLNICCYQDSIEYIQKYVEYLTEKRVDGIIVSPIKTTVDYLEPARKAGIPTVVLEDTYGVENCDVLQVDCASAAYQLVEHLIRQGHREIAIIKGTEGMTTSRERLNGYLRVMEDYGFPVREEFLIKGDYDYLSGFEGVRKLWTLKRKPTALFVTNYHMSVGALVAVNRLNIKVPDELSIVAFDDMTLSSIVKPKLTAVHQPIEEIMEKACELIERRMNGDFEGYPGKWRLKAEIVYRDSVAKAQRNNV